MKKIVLLCFISFAAFFYFVSLTETGKNAAPTENIFESLFTDIPETYKEYENKAGYEIVVDHHTMGTPKNRQLAYKITL
jgi:hypothetical protein